MPALAVDILEQPLGGVPTVELDVDRPVGRQQRPQGFQNGAGQEVLTAKSQTLLGRASAVEPSHGLGPQVQTQLERGREAADPRRAFQVAKGLVVAGPLRCRFVMIVEPIDRLQATGLLVFLAQRIVQVEEYHLGQATTAGLVEQPSEVASAQAVPNQVGRPGADAEKIGPVGRVGGVEELALQSSQGFAVFADQQGVGQLEQVLALRLGQVGGQGLQEGVQGGGGAYNTG